MVPAADMKLGLNKILCVEDDRETADLIAEDLSDRGYGVTLAHDGCEFAPEEKVVEFGYRVTWPAAKKITYGQGS